MLDVRYEGSVLHLTLNRPEVRNALNDELIHALQTAFDELRPETRAVVLAGHGEAFCAGGDLNWLRKAANFTEEENYEDALRLVKLFKTICHCPAVVIARVHGPAFGGGCGLVAASDIALASDHARFAFSEVRLGLVPATVSPFVIRKIGAGHSRALFSTGEVFDAGHAFAIGLIHYSGSLEHVDCELKRKLGAILVAGPKAVSEAKLIAQRPPLDDEGAARLLARTRLSEEARAGMSAFLQKESAPYAEHS